jgi:hypothetical protein
MRDERNKSVYLKSVDTWARLGVERKGASKAVEDAAHRFEVLLSPHMRRIARLIGNDKLIELHHEFVKAKGYTRNGVEVARQLIEGERWGFNDQELVALTVMLERG